MVSCAYLRLLISLPEILIPACASSSLAFLMIYSAYKWYKHGDNIQPWRTPFPILNQSIVPCPVLTLCFLTCIQVSQKVGKVVWYSHLFQNFPQFVVIHTVRDFSIVNEAEVDVFWNSWTPWTVWKGKNKSTWIRSIWDDGGLWGDEDRKETSINGPPLSTPPPVRCFLCLFPFYRWCIQSSVFGWPAHWYTAVSWWIQDPRLPQTPDS